MATLNTMPDGRLPGEDPDLGGRLTRLRPWHYVAIAAAVIVVFLLFRIGSAVLGHAAHKEMTQAQLNAGSAGQPFTPMPVEPVAARQVMPPIMPRPVMMPQPMSPFGGAKKSDDAALDAPIMMGSPGQQAAAPAAAAVHTAANGGTDDNALSESLKPTMLQGFKATRIRDPQWVIEQGRIIACTDVTAVNSQLPGFIKAKLPNDVWSMDGSNILLERGSTMFGEITHGLENGADRLFVLWRQVTTPAPNFVRITLNSPAADELGVTGLDGDVNRHMWRKIGGALLISAIEMGVQGAASGLTGLIGNHNGQNGAGSTNLNFYQYQGQGDTLAQQYYNSVINVPDVLTRHQAQPCSAFVAGDLDFSSVYRDVVR